jgi:hypothetical protein
MRPLTVLMGSSPQGLRRGVSNWPVMKRIASVRLTAVSMSAGDSRPAASAGFSCRSATCHANDVTTSSVQQLVQWTGCPTKQKAGSMTC